MPEFEIALNNITFSGTTTSDLPIEGINWHIDIVQVPIVLPELSPKRKLLKDRVKLIRALCNIEPREYAKTMDEVHLLQLIPATIREDKDNHFLSYSQEDKGMVSYSLKPQHKYDNDRRYKTTLGRYVRKLLKVDSDSISDRTLENLAYNMFGELAEPSDLPIEVITGKDITNAYCDKIGGETCMTDDRCCYTEIYEMNPNKVAMVVYDGKARALLWTTDKGIKIMDRIYPNEGSHVGAMYKWAKSKDYISRNGNHMADPDDMGRVLGKDQHYVTLKHNDVFPYMDTFMHGQINDGHIKVSNLPMGDDDVILQEQDGCYYAGIKCCNCDEQIPEDEVNNIDDTYYCNYCYSDLFSECGRCNDPTYRDNMYGVDGENWCEYCYDEHSSSCEECGNSHSETYEGDDGYLRCKSCHANYEESQVESTSTT